jgi:hypothetical protein
MSTESATKAGAGFPVKFIGVDKSMRLSLKKAAHVAVSWARVQEIRGALTCSTSPQPGKEIRAEGPMNW